MSYRRYCLLLIPLSLALVPLFLAIPAKSTLMRALNDSAHTALFTLITVGLLYAITITQNRRKNPIHPYHLYIVVGLIGLFLGAGIEFIQHFIGRSATWDDIKLDSIGIIAGLLFYAALGAQSVVRKIVGLIIALSILSLGFLKPIKWFYFENVRDSTIPTLVDFDNPVVMNFIARSYGARINRRPAPLEWENNTQVLRVFFPDTTKLPGFRMREVAPDWSRYNTLHFEVFAKEDQANHLHMAIRDRQSLDDGKQFVKTLKIVKGLNIFNIPLHEIQQAKARPFNLGNMRYFAFYVAHPKQPSELYFDNIELQYIERQ